MSSEISGNPWHWKVRSTGNLWMLAFIAAILINSLLIFAVQVWIVYNADAEDPLAEYPGYTVLSRAESDDLTVYLLASPEGTEQLVTLEKHVYADQYRIVKNGTKEISEEPQSVTVWGDALRGTVTVENGQITSCVTSPLRFSLPIGSSGGRVNIPLAFFLYGILLMAVELGGIGLFGKIKGQS